MHRTPASGHTSGKRLTPGSTSDAVTAQRAERRTKTVDRYTAAASGSAPALRRVHDATVVDHLGVAETIARRYVGDWQDGSDIQQVAYLGLVKAARRFDPQLGDDFVSFAVPTIAGEIKRHLRDHSWFVRPPRRVQELHSAISRTVPQLMQDLGRVPTRGELAEILGEDSTSISRALDSQQSLRPVSLDSPVTDDESVTLGDTIGQLDAGLERAELVAEVRTACRRLSPRERRILYLRFFEERTQQEIAAQIGVTQMQVSRLLTRILDQLRTDLVAA